jgi:ATP-grasp domain
MAGAPTLNILYGVVFAIAVSVADLLRRVARPHDAIFGQVSGLARMHDVDDYPTAHTIPGLVVYRYDSPLFFDASYHRMTAPNGGVPPVDAHAPGAVSGSRSTAMLDGYRGRPTVSRTAVQ